MLKKAQRGFETIRHGSTFDNPMRLQSIFSNIMEDGFPNSDYQAKIMVQKVGGGYIEPYKIRITSPNRSKL